MPAYRHIDLAYHLLDAENLESVERHGLLSTRRLAHLGGNMDVRELRLHRPASQRLTSGAKIRDQWPMPPEALARALDAGLRPEDWYELLNSKVFFWLDVERLNRQRAACGTALQLALVIDVARLLDQHGDSASVSPINTGNATRTPALRNTTTFVPYSRWLRDGWAHEVVTERRTRPCSHRPVELTIHDAVPDALNYVLGMIPLPHGQKLGPFRHPRG